MLTIRSAAWRETSTSHDDIPDWQMKRHWLGKLMLDRKLVVQSFVHGPILFSSLFSVRGQMAILFPIN
jgi:hypothetical protein